MDADWDEVSFLYFISRGSREEGTMASNVKFRCVRSREGGCSRLRTTPRYGVLGVCLELDSSPATPWLRSPIAGRNYTPHGAHVQPN